MEYHFLSEKEKEFFRAKKVILRAGLNVPLEDGKIENDFRLRAILPTLNFLLDGGAQLTVIGHLGREKENNLESIFLWLKKNLKNRKVTFDPGTFREEKIKNLSEHLKELTEKLEEGELLLLDNLRASEGEKENSKELAEKVAPHFDFYINEAFPVSHRKHMSMDALPALFDSEKRFYGFRYEEELKVIEKIKNPESFKKKVFILGGAKIATKIPMIRTLIDKFDLIVLGGAVANNFYLEMGYPIGNSFYDEDFVFEQEELSKIMSSHKIFLPQRVITENGEKNISEILPGDKILDISPKSFESIEKDLREADFVFFNGPLGYYEGGYEDGTKYLLNILTNPNNFFVAGGGNTASIIFELKLEKNVDFISTGGGALIKAISE